MKKAFNQHLKKITQAKQKIDCLAICSRYTIGNDQISTLNTEHFNDVLSGNLRDTILTLRECVPYLNKNASVVILSSVIR